MKKYLVLLFLLISTLVYAGGVLDFTSDTSPTSDDIIYVINDPLGVPGDRKVTIGNLPKGMIGGATTQVQFNEAGVFGGDAEFTWNTTSKILTVNTGGITLGTGGVFKLPDGTAAAPSLAFASNPDSGMYTGYSGNSIDLTVNSVTVFRLGSTYLNLYLSSLRLASVNGGEVDVFMVADAANTLALSNDVNLQKFNIYNTRTDASNYERLALTGVAGASVNLTAETLGTGGDNLDIILTPAGTGQVQIGGYKLPAAVGTLGYLYKSDGTDVVASNSISGITLSGFTASKGLCSDVSGNAVACTNLTDTVTGTGSVVLGTGPAITAAEIDGSTTVDWTALPANVKRTIINSYGRGAAATLTLPTGAAGYTFIGIVGTQHNSAWKFLASGTDHIYWDSGGTLTAGKHYFQETNQAIGSRISCATFKTGAAQWDWICGSISGTWVTD